MATEYTITIRNQSGAQQNYLIFNETPMINKQVDSNVWLNVFQRRATPPGQVCTFKIRTNYSAVCGSADDKPGAGVSVSVGAPSPVTLGKADPNGSLKTPGTSYMLTVIGGAPQFKTDPITPNGSINAFEIKTDNSFTYQDAVNANYLIGLGGDAGGSGLTGPAATFVPQPGKSYQIEPVKKYWVATGDYEQGSMIKVAYVSDKAVPVDYSTRQQLTANMVHDANGNINLQA